MNFKLIEEDQINRIVEHLTELKALHEKRRLKDLEDLILDNSDFIRMMKISRGTA